MTHKEFYGKTEDLLQKLATTASHKQNKEDVQLLKEALFDQAFEILTEKLDEDEAFKVSDRVLAAARKELKQRRKLARAAAVAATSDKSDQDQEVPLQS